MRRKSGPGNNKSENRTVNFGSTGRTGHVGPPPEVVPNIPIEPNRNGPFHLTFDRNFRNIWINGKHPISLTLTWCYAYKLLCFYFRDLSLYRTSYNKLATIRTVRQLHRRWATWTYHSTRLAVHGPNVLRTLRRTPSNNPRLQNKRQEQTIHAKH